MVRIGLLGCGFMGGMHLQCYRAIEGAEVVAIADVRPEFLERAVGENRCSGYRTAEELIEKADVDVIDVCLPTFLHTEHAVKSIEKGIHTFIEKPVCFSERECGMLEAAEASSEAFVQVGQVIRFWDEYEYLKKLIENQIYGRVVHAKFSRVSPAPNWGWDNWLHDVKRSGGAGLDLHIHDSDFMLYLFGRPKKFYTLKNVLKETNGFVYTLADYGDYVVNVEGGWEFPKSYPFEMSFRVVFERATVELFSKGLWVYPDEGTPFPVESDEKKPVASSNQGGNISSLGGYFKELDYFTHCVAAGERPNRASLHDGVESVRFVLNELKEERA